MISDDVGVTCCFKGALLPPSLVSQAEDQGAEREDEGDSQRSEANVHIKTNRRALATQNIVVGG